MHKKNAWIWIALVILLAAAAILWFTLGNKSAEKPEELTPAEELQESAEEEELTEAADQQQEEKKEAEELKGVDPDSQLTEEGKQAAAISGEGESHPSEASMLEDGGDLIIEIPDDQLSDGF